MTRSLLVTFSWMKNRETDKFEFTLLKQLGNGSFRSLCLTAYESLPQNSIFHAACCALALWAAFILPKFHFTPKRIYLPIMSR